jgi:hypothetical protein
MAADQAVIGIQNAMSWTWKTMPASVAIAARDPSGDCFPLGVATEEGRGSPREGALHHTNGGDAAASRARADRALNRSFFPVVLNPAMGRAQPSPDGGDHARVEVDPATAVPFAPGSGS